MPRRSTSDTFGSPLSDSLGYDSVPASPALPKAAGFYFEQVGEGGVVQ
jgi:hypothetical protein